MPVFRDPSRNRTCSYALTNNATSLAERAKLAFGPDPFTRLPLELILYQASYCDYHDPAPLLSYSASRLVVRTHELLLFS
jgi:hypothetical protein